MKKIVLILFLLPVKFLIAQAAVIENDIALYHGKSFKEGDIVHLGYGSSGDKDFSFVHYGKAPAGMKIPGLYHKANADWSKAEIEITKVYTEKGVVWIKGEPTNRGKNPGGLLGNKIFINLTGAIDNGEIASVERGEGKKSKNDLKATTADLKNNLKLSKEELAKQLTEAKLKLKQAYGDNKEKLKVSGSEVKSKMKGTVSTMKEDLNTQLKNVKATGKAALDENKTKLKEQLSSLKEKGKETLKETKQKIKGG